MKNKIQKVKDFIYNNDLIALKEAMLEIPSSSKRDFNLFLSSIKNNNKAMFDYFLEKLTDTSFLKKTQYVSEILDHCITEASSDSLSHILNKLIVDKEQLCTAYLFKSIYNNKFEHTQVLKNNGGDIENLLKNSGSQMLFLCFLNNNIEAMDFIVKNGSIIEIEKILSLLNTSVKLTTFQRLESYIRPEQLDIFNIQYYNDNVIKLVVLQENIPILNYLLEKGCDVKIAYKYAKLDNNEDLAKYLEVYDLTNSLHKNLDNQKDNIMRKKL